MPKTMIKQNGPQVLMEKRQRKMKELISYVTRQPNQKDGEMCKFWLAEQPCPCFI